MKQYSYACLCFIHFIHWCRYTGTITAVHSDGTCDITYDDGDSEENKDPALIQPDPGTPR